MDNHDRPAYPVLHVTDGNWVPGPNPEFMGLTKREAFAMAAMQAMIGTAAIPVVSGMAGAESTVARAAFRMADAMLAASAEG